MFSYESCEIFKNTYFYRTPPVAASIIIFIVDDQVLRQSQTEQQVREETFIVSIKMHNKRFLTQNQLNFDNL